jgi:lipoprotein NlpD
MSIGRATGRLGRPAPALALLTLLTMLLVGCASPTHKAPVESRAATPAPRPAGTAPAPVAPAAPAASTPVAGAETPAKVLPGAENAGKPGFYTVKPGDTLIRIGLDNGQNWRDIARWNGLDNANLIEVGQVLRVVPPGADANGVVARPVAPGGRVDGRPLPGTAAGGEAAASGAAPTTASPAPVAATPPAPTPAPTPAAPPVAREGEDELNWSWPAAGPVATGFDDARNKGLALTGKAGDPVLAAADGRVVYAGSGLRGYGNLIIVKHNATYLSAYAHNQALLVKEDQVVRRGQKIAEMGSSDADRVQLHFEIRRLGKPIDPAKLLPPR